MFAFLFQSDIFSLGVVLVEILVPFATAMERSRTFDKLRRGQVPEQLESASPAIVSYTFFLFL